MLITNALFSPRCAAGFISLLLALCAAEVAAGSLDAPAAPTNAVSAMFTLQDLCNRLSNGTAGTTRSGPFVEPTAGPAATMCTLNDIMTAMPALDNANGAVVADVLAGKTFWGLTGGAWGLKTGTATAGANVTGTNGQLVVNIPNGLYSGGKTATAADTNLIAGNIRTGVTLFGVAGSAVAATGDATDADVLASKTYSSTSGASTGTMPTQTLSATSTTVNAGYYVVTDLTTVDGDLATANIRSGITIFGVPGNSNVVNTSSGDAGAADLATGKKAWVDGAEVTGTASGATAAVPKTGQTTSYVTGDDGDLEKGATWPSPRFTDNGNGTVTDNLTGLMWMKNADAGNDCAGADAGTEDWTTALSSAAACNTSSYAGYTDWRLPNRRELFSLIDDSRTNPALPSGHPFTGVLSSPYWSSTTDADNPSNNAWRVGLDGGGVSSAGKTAGRYVWPVRGGL